MLESSQPSEADQRVMMAAALEAVMKAQSTLATRKEADTVAVPEAESRVGKETMRDFKMPTRQAEDLKVRFPEEYKRTLRAAARILERDTQTRHEIYRLLGCAPEERKDKPEM